ncbi:MAG TPA: N-6 DNA methylase, partial [Candidatus Dojkabacteria bacterium]|nr:N-6 DNA methylase [Candidatus Dojkabacteria bacterium]
MNIQEYLNKYVNRISSLYNGNDATEYTYRTDFQELLQNVFEDIKVEEIKQESRTGDDNKPDFIIAKNKVPLLYIETKDIGVSLDKIEKSEQMSRYFGYANLVLTDYLEFRFYRNGLPYGEHISIGTFDKKSRSITPIPHEFEHLSRKLVEFPQSYKEPITSGKHLAKIMGGKAQRIRDNLKTFLSVESERNNEIVKVFESFKQLLVHDLDRDSFADMYAQTLVYGLFVARYYDDSPDTFTRQEARDLIPKSNPFLGSFFDHIVGPNFDDRLEHIVDELCMVFSHSNVKELMGEYFKQGEGKDPVIHFYEDFLNEYDSVLRKRMGAYYTPQPVVNFIVRSVDYILKKDFNLQRGLVDSSKFEDGTHRVQVLDPAVGTGTFISTVLNFIYSSIKNSNQPGI